MTKGDMGGGTGVPEVNSRLGVQGFGVHGLIRDQGLGIRVV